MLHTVVADMKRKGITPLYLITDLTDFYEKYGWEFFCMVQGEEDPEQIRMYIHRRRGRESKGFLLLKFVPPCFGHGMNLSVSYIEK